MKYLFSILLLAITNDDPLNQIARVNEIKREAQEAYLNKDYSLALEKYQYLSDSLLIKDENLLLNLSHSYFHLNDSANARNHYLKLADSKTASIKSLAFQQLGVLASQNKMYQQALDLFKESLRADPGNDDSRYNYELLKKFLENQKDDQQQLR